MEFCIHCGALLPDDARTCPACGRALPAAPQTPPTPGTYPAAAQPAQPHTPAPPAAPRPGIVMPPQPSAAPPSGGPGAPFYAAGPAAQPPRAPAPPDEPGAAPPPPGGQAAFHGPRYAAPQSEGLSTAGYLGTLLLFLIPVAGFVLMLLWSFLGGVKPERRKLARAYLIRTLILAGVVMLLAMAAGIGISALLASDPYFFYDFYG